uniref:ETS homologous factor n=1 Tax=Timema cristinae TaxID=61476 RepID=A0A7R9GSN1_TIMCR|nr:unnamed protein product [Timema cristinae]
MSKGSARLTSERVNDWAANLAKSSSENKWNLWKEKLPEDWNSEDIMNWIISVCKTQGIEYENVKMKNFSLKGSSFKELSEKQFIDLDPVYGSLLYQELSHILSRHADTLPTFLNMFPPQSPTTLTTLTPFKASVKEEKSNKEKLLISTCDPQKGGGQPTCQGPPQQRLAKRPGPGRPPGGRGKRKPEKKCGRLWEFIRDLLLNQDYCPSLICWEDYEQGMFRFVRSEGVAKLWGTIKENPRMNYEKLSRAMRYYYKSKVLQPVLGRRLVYKFGPTAKGWRTPNPNFKNPE